MIFLNILLNKQTKEGNTAEQKKEGNTAEQKGRRTSAGQQALETLLRRKLNLSAWYHLYLINCTKKRKYTTIISKRYIWSVVERRGDATER